MPLSHRPAPYQGLLADAATKRQHIFILTREVNVSPENGQQQEY
jgi:hypothetical protein